MQRWCNWGGKDGICAQNGQLLVHPIERMDGIYPHGKDFQSSRPIRSQTPINTDNYSSLLSGSAMRLNCVGPNRVFIDYQVAFLGYQVGFMVHLWCRRGGQDGNNILISAY